MQRLLLNGELNNRLGSYYRNHVEMSQTRTKQRVEEVMPIVNSIMKYINDKDPRFSRQVICVGSYWQNLKVKEADEFDFHVPLVNCHNKLVWGGDERERHYGYSRPVDGERTTTVPQDLDIVVKPNGPPLPPPPVGYVFIPAPITEGIDRRCQTTCESRSSVLQAARLWQDSTDMVREGDLVPFLVRKRFKELLTMAIRDLNLRETVKQSRRVHGPALTLTVSVSLGGPGEVSLDFSPIVPVKLPFGGCVAWPRPGIQWPKQDKVAEIKELGIHVIAKSDFYWLLSFAHLEKVLLEGVDADGGFRKQCHRIMKKINADVWCDTTTKVIDSYSLKTIWLYEMEKRPHKADWSLDKLGERFMFMTNALLAAIDTEKLPRYFNPNVNLMEGKNSQELRIARLKIMNFLENPTILM